MVYKKNGADKKFMGRILIFTGKGGVGKTSVAAAHALASAREGKKTLLVSTDMAHNLGDIFQVKLGNKIKRIDENLSVLELSPSEYIKKNFSDIQKALIDLFGNSTTIYQLGNNFMIPGFDNLFSLLNIKDIYDSGSFERIIVDCAPTGETLSLLKLPELLSWYMEKFFPVGKQVVRVLSPVAKFKYKLKMPNRKAMNDIEKIHNSLVELQEFLKNPRLCSIRLVCIPEKMIVEETKRNYMYLNLYKYPVDAVFINRILDKKIENPFIQNWKMIQEKYIAQIESIFAHIPITKIPWYSKEIRGMAAVEELRCNLDKDELFKPMNTENYDEYIAYEEGYILNIPVTVTEDSKVEAVCYEKEVHININQFNRCIPLPDTLYCREEEKIVINSDKIQIYFKIKEDKTKEVKS